MDSFDGSKKLARFTHTSAKDTTGSYMKTNVVSAKVKGAVGNRKVNIFPIIRYMANSENRQVVNEISKTLHHHRIEKLENIMTSNVVQVLDKMHNLASDDKLLDSKDDLEKSHKELANMLSCNLNEAKEAIVRYNLTRYVKTPNSDDVSKINGIIDESNLQKIEKKDTEIIMKQLVSGVETPSQMRYVFSFLQYMRKYDKIDKEAHNLFKKQLVDKIQKKWIPRLSTSQQAEDISYLLSHIESKNYIDTSSIKKNQQVLRRKIVNNFRDLVSFLPDIKSSKSDRAEQYIDNIEMLQSYINLTQDQKIGISKKTLREIDRYVVEGFVIFVNDFYIRSSKTSEEKIQEVKDLQENIVIPLIKFTSAELERKDYIVLPLSKQKAEKKQNQLLEKALGFIHRNITESSQILKNHTPASISKLPESSEAALPHHPSVDPSITTPAVSVSNPLQEDNSLSTKNKGVTLVKNDEENSLSPDDVDYDFWGSEFSDYSPDRLAEFDNEESDNDLSSESGLGSDDESNIARLQRAIQEREELKRKQKNEAFDDDNKSIYEEITPDDDLNKTQTTSLSVENKKSKQEKELASESDFAKSLREKRKALGITDIDDVEDDA
jgi:hypothetical protein